MFKLEYRLVGAVTAIDLITDVTRSFTLVVGPETMDASPLAGVLFTNVSTPHHRKPLIRL